MNWSSLKFAANKFLQTAAFALFLYPLLLEALHIFGTRIEFKAPVQPLRVSMAGAIVYLGAALFVHIRLPSCIKSFGNKKEYQNWCSENCSNIIASAEFADVISCNHETLQRHFPQFGHLIPIEVAGEIASRDQLCFVYGEMQFRIAEDNEKGLRWFLTFILVTSLLLVFTPHILRIWHGFGYGL